MQSVRYVFPACTDSHNAHYSTHNNAQLSSQRQNQCIMPASLQGGIIGEDEEGGSATGVEEGGWWAPGVGLKKRKKRSNTISRDIDCAPQSVLTALPRTQAHVKEEQAGGEGGAEGREHCKVSVLLTQDRLIYNHSCCPFPIVDAELEVRSNTPVHAF